MIGEAGIVDRTWSSDPTDWETVAERSEIHPKISQNSPRKEKYQSTTTQSRLR